MARLAYSAICSLDGYVEDASGGFAWAEPDEEVHRFINEQERRVGTYLYGRRMYQTMAFWETAPSGQPTATSEYAAIWRAADKVVFSTTLSAASSARTRIEPAFVPEQVRALKTESAQDLSIGGAELAGHALRAGLVDEVHLFVVPVVVGGGKRALSDGVRLGLRLREARAFGSGVVHLGYESVGG